METVPSKTNHSSTPRQILQEATDSLEAYDDLATETTVLLAKVIDKMALHWRHAHRKHLDGINVWGQRSELSAVKAHIEDALEVIKFQED